MSADVLVMEEGNATEMLLARQCMAVLLKHYPGFDWNVHVQGDQGIVTVHNFSLSGRWGFILHLKDVQEDARLREVMLAGGEVLERYRLRRGGLNPESLDSLPVDFKGEFIPERG